MSEQMDNTQPMKWRPQLHQAAEVLALLKPLSSEDPRTYTITEAECRLIDQALATASYLLEIAPALHVEAGKRAGEQLGILLCDAPNAIDPHFIPVIIEIVLSAAGWAMSSESTAP